MGLIGIGLGFGCRVFIAAILGVITATFFIDDLRTALISDYAGSGFFRGLNKNYFKK